MNIDEPLGIQHNQLLLKGGHKKHQVGLLIQQLVLSEFTFCEDVLIFHYLKNKGIRLINIQDD